MLFIMVRRAGLFSTAYFSTTGYLLSTGTVILVKISGHQQRSTAIL
jgi:hypothetical protein